MKSPEQKETWISGASYESYVGRWSRLVARELLAWLAVPPGARWLDVGCGTGALSKTILEMASPHSVLAVDSSEGFLAFAREQSRDERVHFLLANAQALPVESAICDAVVSGLVLNFVPQPELAMREMVRAVREGGVVAVYVWDYAEHMQVIRFFWDAAVALDPAASLFDEGQRFPLCQPDHLRQLFHAVRLEQVEVRVIDIPTAFRDFEDYWLPFLGGQGPAPSYVLSLSEERRAALREHLRALLPFAHDGSLQLNARAWAIRGVRGQSKTTNRESLPGG